MDPLYRSAFDLADDIRAGTRSARELLEFFLDRIERFNPGLNAVVALDTERARVRADAADAAAAAGEDWGPLHGVPVTIKDALATAGLVTAGGVPAWKANVPEHSAVAVQRYVDAGAIIFGKTNVPFMSADLQAYNDVYGVTNNPWDVTRTSGGSSGGAAAALAAGLTPLELGSDIGGSIRTPSHFNGVYGHKPSFNLVPQRGHLPPGDGVLSEDDLSVIGPLGTCPQDLEKALDILVGPLPEEGVAWQVKLPPARATEPAGLRVGVWLDDPAFPVDREIQAAIAAAAQTLAAAGAQVDLDAHPRLDMEEQHRNYAMLLAAVMGSRMPEAVFEGAVAAVAAADPDDMTLLMQQMRGIAQSHREWLRQHEQRQHYRAQWAQFFQQYDVLLCPCAAVLAFPHDHNPDLYQRELVVNGETMPYLDILGWAGLTLNSYLPVTAAPVGMSSAGLPIGMQLVGPYLEDRTPLAVAGMLQRLHRGFVAPPGY